MAVGLFAFTLVFLGPFLSALGALALVLFNLFILPRAGGRRLWRHADAERGSATGIVLYPVAVLALILVFWSRLEIAAAVWGILAFGDGMAAVLGTAWGRARLPWNPRKSWVGSLSCGLFGALGAASLLTWTLTHQGGAFSLPFIVLCAVLTSLFAAFLESLPQGLDDNLTVPIPSGLVLYGLLLSESFWPSAPLDELLTAAVVGVAVHSVPAFAAWRARALDLSGALAGILLGATIFTFQGWRGVLLLGVFFVLGTAATRLGIERKTEARLAQEAGGRRSARHALANAGVAALAAVFATTTPYPALCLSAFAAAFATATADTLSSEIGQLWAIRGRGRRTFLITNLKPVSAGTDGGVSLAGTLAGLAGSLSIAVLGSAIGLYPASGILVVTLAGFLGTTLDSLLGATLERRGLLDNEGVNALATLGGALAAAGMTAILGPPPGL